MDSITRSAFASTRSGRATASRTKSTPISTDAKLAYIGMLASAGLREIEATSFVSPRAIPQLADADDADERACVGQARRSALPGPGAQHARHGSRRGRRRNGPGGVHRGERRVHEAQHRDDDRRVTGRVPAGPGPRDRARLVETRVCVDRLRLPVHGQRGAVEGRRCGHSPGRAGRGRNLHRRHDRRRRP